MLVVVVIVEVRNVGLKYGTIEDSRLGITEADEVGVDRSANDGDSTDGTTVGRSLLIMQDGFSVGTSTVVGAVEGSALEISLGNDDGITEGAADGSSDGFTLGTVVGAVEGPAVGTVLGASLGDDDDGITEGATD